MQSPSEEEHAYHSEGEHAYYDAETESESESNRSENEFRCDWGIRCFDVSRWEAVSHLVCRSIMNRRVSVRVCHLDRSGVRIPHERQQWEGSERSWWAEPPQLEMDGA